MFKNLLKKRESGFTIIEVLIVLAIAGLILVVVLVAIPQLQRNQRNEDRRAKVARITTEIGNFSGNNNGIIPTESIANGSNLDSVVERYLGCDPATPFGPWLFMNNCTVDSRDPKTGGGFAFRIGNTAVGATPTLNQATLFTGDLGVIYYQVNRTCDGERLATGGGRNFVLYTVQEGGAIVCLDNG